MRSALCLILVAGCAVPLRPEPTASADDPARLPEPNCLIRVGIEYLPPSGVQPETTVLTYPGSFLDGAGKPEPRRTAQPRMVVSPVDLGPPPMSLESSDRQLRWDLRDEEIRKKSSTIERFALHFISELIGDDRKRVQRAIGGPLLGAQLRVKSDPQANFLDERDNEDRQSLLNRNGTRMIRRPLRNAVKQLPLFDDFEKAIHEFKGNSPGVADRSSGGFGRVSVRLRGGHLDDPIELVWIRHGFRLGSTMQKLKVSFTQHLRSGLSLRIWTRYDYDDSNLRLLGTLEYKLNDYTTINALAGNRVNTLSGPATYPGGPQSDESTKGMLLYVEHLF